MPKPNTQGLPTREKIIEFITTSETSAGKREIAKAFGIEFEEQKQALLNKVSLRTFVSAQDIANMALFLATDAGKHISGQALAVCGNVETLV